jgi:hypothetical protein
MNQKHGHFVTLPFRAGYVQILLYVLVSSSHSLSVQQPDDKRDYAYTNTRTKLIIDSGL